MFYAIAELMVATSATKTLARRKALETVNDTKRIHKYNDKAKKKKRRFQCNLI